MNSVADPIPAGGTAAVEELAQRILALPGLEKLPQEQLEALGRVAYGRSASCGTWAARSTARGSTTRPSARSSLHEGLRRIIEDRIECQMINFSTDWREK